MCKQCMRPMRKTLDMQMLDACRYPNVYLLDWMRVFFYMWVWNTQLTLGFSL